MLPGMKTMFQGGLNGRVPVPPEKRVIIHPFHSMGLRLKAHPRSLSAAWEGGNVSWTRSPSADGGTASIQLDRVQIHEAIVIETDEKP